MKILVTGFEPFLGERLNPSEMLANELEQNFPEVKSLILPVEFARSFEILKKHLDSNSSYDFLIMIGQASGRSKICFEKIGLNWIQTEHRDEKGVLPAAGRIAEGGPLALMTEFPVDEVFTQLKADQFPVEISFSAGTFVCNDLYFRVLQQYPNQKSVFIHVPLIQAQATEGKPFISYSEGLICFSEIIEFLKKKYGSQ